MNILLTGGTGFVGVALEKKLTKLGHKLSVVTRSRASAQKKLLDTTRIIECDLNNTILSETNFTEIDVVVNLVGESIQGRWTNKKKQEIKNSRIQATKNLLHNLPATVKTVVTASAIGFYGDRGDELLTENSTQGEGFLSKVCQE
jgi:NAD dependent epimerase/dehydratase family enzyme